jgi:hypothetical protein
MVFGGRGRGSNQGSGEGIVLRGWKMIKDKSEDDGMAL